MRVIPVSSGEWSWWLPVIFLGIGAFFAIIGTAKRRLDRYPGWHTALVLVVTLLAAAVLTARSRDADWTVFLVMLVPSSAAVGLIYNIAMSFKESGRDDQRG